MINPIIQALTSSNNNLLGIISALKTGNADAMLQQMANNNPQFKNFLQANQGKSIEQIAQENGVDLNVVKNLLR